MGYSTSFAGHFAVTPPLSLVRREYLRAFSYSRRLTRDPKRALKVPDWRRTAVGLPVGLQGGYCVSHADSDDGQPRPLRYARRRKRYVYADPSVLDADAPPAGQPSLWCQWCPSADGARLGWTGSEKFHEYRAWLEYLIEHFLAPWGHRLDGEVRWQGDGRADRGRLKVTNNKVRTLALAAGDAPGGGGFSEATEFCNRPDPAANLLTFAQQIRAWAVRPDAPGGEFLDQVRDLLAAGADLVIDAAARSEVPNEQ